MTTWHDWMTSVVKWFDPLDALDQAVRQAMFRQPAAKAFSLSAYADAEGTGEGAVFDRALLRSSDPEVTRMIRRHQQDERNHAQWLAERRDALGLPAQPIPAHLRTIEILSAEAGGVLDLPMTEDAHVAAVYALLYVVEERALLEFDQAARALDAVGDAESAALFRRIAQDERNHLRYCSAVGAKFSDAAAWDASVASMRVIEARVYAHQQRQFTRFVVDSGRFVMPRWMRLVTLPTVAMADWLRPATA